MSPSDLDRELQCLFDGVRREDEASAPAFREVLHRSTPPRRSSSLRPAAALTAAVLIAAAGFAILLLRPPSRGPLPSVAVSVAEWRSPTGALLQTPTDPLLESVPDLSPSVPNYSRFEAVSKSRDTTPRPTRRAPDRD